MELGQLIEPKPIFIFSLASLLSTQVLFTSKNMGASECLDLLEFCSFGKRLQSRSGSLGEAVTVEKAVEDGKTAPSSFDKRELGAEKEQAATATKESNAKKGEPASSTKEVEMTKELGPSKKEMERENKKQAACVEKPDWGSSSQSSPSSSDSSSSSSSAKPPEEKKARVESFDKRDSPAESFGKRDSAGLGEAFDKRVSSSTYYVRGQADSASNTGKVDWRLKVNPSHRLAIDWFQTIRLKHDVPASHVKALQKLRAAGYELVLLSFCGRQRELQVRQEATALPVTFCQMKFTSRKTGPEGKVAWCKRLSCGYLFDDDDDIL